MSAFSNSIAALTFLNMSQIFSKVTNIHTLEMAKEVIFISFIALVLCFFAQVILSVKFCSFLPTPLKHPQKPTDLSLEVLTFRQSLLPSLRSRIKEFVVEGRTAELHQAIHSNLKDKWGRMNKKYAAKYSTFLRNS